MGKMMPMRLEHPDEIDVLADVLPDREREELSRKECV